MVYKLALAAEDRWRRIRSPHPTALVHAGVQFRNGEQITVTQSAESVQIIESGSQGVAA